jgi:outer membrane scaffolding protein for murein synthesis (MipA/OmpV family)
LIMSRRNILALAIVVSLSMMALPALGQTPLPLANWQYSSGEVLAPLGGPVPEWRVTVGAGAMLQPNFEGAKRYEVEPSGILDIRYRDLAFLSDGEGLGINLVHGPGYRAGIAIGYDLGRDTHEDPRLLHLSHVSPAADRRFSAPTFRCRLRTVTPFSFSDPRSRWRMIGTCGPISA